MLKTFRKSIAIMLALVFVLSLVPFSAMAEGAEASTETVTLTRVQHVYNDKNNKDSAGKGTNTSNPSASISHIQMGSDYRFHAIAKYDFSGYEEILKNDGTKVFFNFVPKSSSEPTKKFEVYIAKDACDTYNLEGITYNQANNLGFYDRPTSRCIYSKTDTVIEKTAFSSGELDVSKFINALDEGVDNSTLAFYFYGLQNGYLAMAGNTPTKIAITYDKNAVDNQDYVDGLLAELDWSKISSESFDNVSDVSKLPLKYKGANVTWTSSNHDVVNPETGVITQPKSGTVNVTLTASLSYTDYLGNTVTAEGSKEINITVAAEQLKSVVIPLSEHTFISRADAGVPKGPYEVSTYVRYMYPAGLYGTGNDRLVFLKWDFSDHLDKLAVATSMSMSMKNMDKNFKAGYGTILSVLPDGYEIWTEKDLTYNDAVEKGLYTTPGIYTQTVSPLSLECEIASSAEFLNAIKKSVADNPDDGVVNFRWESTSNNGNTAYRLYGDKKENFTITLYYYQSDLADNYANSMVPSMPWSYVSQQPQDKVVADLTLPGKFYGETVTWKSSDEAVITNTGVVVAGDNGGTATLTATVNGSTKEFEVTVPANTKFVLDSSKQNYVNGYVWAKEAVNNCALVVATYVDGELISVKVKDDSFNLNKGENFIWTDLDGTGAGKTVKVMLLEDMINLKPLAIAK